MPSPQLLTGLAAGALALSALLTWAARRYALRMAMLDRPGARRSHTIPTPRGGGVGIVLTVVVLAVGWIGFNGADAGLVTLLGGTLAVAAVGWWDDHRDLSAALRLLVHLAAAAALSLTVLGMPTQALDWVLLGLAVLGVAGMVNLWNFMDGINGIAASQAAIVALALAVLPGALDPAPMVVAVVLAAACLGFLPFNFPRARIFLGDVGSGGLGFMIAGLLLLSAVTSSPGQWPALMLLPVAFIVDAGTTLGWRVIRGRRWWQAHREHLYQWAVRKGHSHGKITGLYMCAAFAAVIMANLLWHAPGPLAWGIVIAVYATAAVAAAAVKWHWTRRRRTRRFE